MHKHIANNYFDGIIKQLDLYLFFRRQRKNFKLYLCIWGLKQKYTCIFTGSQGNSDITIYINNLLY